VIMTVYLMTNFIDDLKSADDQRFVRRVFNQVFDSNYAFKKGQDDHRYKGINDAWIRYVSQGGPAYRIIFIKKDVSIQHLKVHPRQP